MKIFQTKSILFAIATALVVLTTLPILQSCSKDDEPQILESKQLEYLDIDVSNLQNPTKEQSQILLEAINRFDKYVIYQNNIFSVKLVNGESIRISEKLFNHLKCILNESNNKIKGMGLVLKENSKNVLCFPKRTINKNTRFKIGGSEDTNIATGGGIDMFDSNWYGLTINLSYRSCVLIAAANGSVAVISSVVSGLCPASAPVSVIVAGIAGLGSIFWGTCASLYPQGVRFEFVYVIVPPFILPSGLSGQ